MSGAYGWGGHGVGNGGGGGGGFTQAKAGYAPSPNSGYSGFPVGAPSGVNPQPVGAARAPVDLSAKKRLVATAKSVIIVALDGTGSMGDWRDEIRRWCKTLFDEAKVLLGDDLEILFLSFGDVGRCSGDRVQATSFGRGPELDDYLMALDMGQAGGGNGRESSEMTAYLVDQLVDVSKAQHVYFFTVTDEAAYAEVDRHIAREWLGVDLSESVPTKSVFANLRKKMDAFVVLKPSDADIKKFWQETVGDERVLALSEGRLVVNVMLGVVARITNQYGTFSQRMASRYGNSQYSQVNQQSVHASVMHIPVGGVPKAPTIKAGTKVLVPTNPGGNGQ